MRSALRFSLPLLCVLLLAGAPGSERSPGGVSLRPSQRAYPPGAKVIINLSNGSSSSLFIPGCASLALEEYREEDDTFVALPPKHCDQEEIAIEVPKGTLPLEYEPSRAKRSILRAVLTYGTGCQQSLPLSKARCQSLHSIRSDSFVVLEARLP